MLPGNYCLISFDVHAGVGVARDATFTWLAGAGLQACGALTDVPTGAGLAVLPVHKA